MVVFKFKFELFKAESESEESDSVDDRRRRPGERGKSAAKDKFEDAGDVYSPIEGYEKLMNEYFKYSNIYFPHIGIG